MTADLKLEIKVMKNLSHKPGAALAGANAKSKS
jgi:hypothetical protein